MLLETQEELLDKEMDWFLRCLIFSNICLSFFACCFCGPEQKNFEPNHMVSVSSSLKVALTCYTGSFEIIFSSPFTAYLNHKNILPA